MTSGMIRIFFILFFILTSSQSDFVWALDSPSEVVQKEWSFYSIGLTPVQAGGRIKPLDSFAREVVLFTFGSRSYHGWNAVDLILSWIAAPQFWNSQPFIQVGREDVRRQLGLDKKRVFYSPEELLKNPIVVQYAERAAGELKGSQPPGAPRSLPRDQELKAVFDRVSLFHSLVSGQGWLLIPKPAPQTWLSLVDGDPEGQLIRSQFVEMLKSYQSADQQAFQRSGFLFRAAIEGEIPFYREESKNRVAAETLYNYLRPFGFAWVTYLIAGFIWIFASWKKRSARLQARVTQFALGFTFLAMSAHILGFGLRCFVAGRPPVTNMYESVVWVSLGIMIFANILYFIHRQGIIFVVATFLAVLGLIVGDVAPAVLDPSIHPLVPVLRSNYWLTIHVLTITLGYAAFALTMGLANITLFQFLRKPNSEKVLTLNQLTYRAMQFGVVLIAAGTILGGIWADYSWGRFWGWDPKEVWALITLLCYLVILHGRYTNWVGQFGFAAWSAVSFMSVVMAWYGVNFILGVGLHSYGFATGGTPWVMGFVAVQLLYVLIVTGVFFKNKASY